MLAGRQTSPSSLPPPKPTMIDLHCHLLPGIDDGPPEMRGSVSLAERALNDGVTVIAATPHAREDHPGVVPGQLAARCNTLRDELGRQEVPLEVVSGAEVDLGWALGASEEDLIAVTYGGRGTDVLVETPYGLLPPGFEDRLHDIFARRGIRVLLAHPERNRLFQSSPKRLGTILSRGIWPRSPPTPCLKASAPRAAGSRTRWWPRAWPRSSRAMPTALADAASLRDALDAVPRADQARARWMVEDAPAAILAGEPLPAPPQGRRRMLRKRFG